MESARLRVYEHRIPPFLRLYLECLLGLRRPRWTRIVLFAALHRLWRSFRRDFSRALKVHAQIDLTGNIRYLLSNTFATMPPELRTQQIARFPRLTYVEMEHVSLPSSYNVLVTRFGTSYSYLYWGEELLFYSILTIPTFSGGDSNTQTATSFQGMLFHGYWLPSLS